MTWNVAKSGLDLWVKQQSSCNAEESEKFLECLSCIAVVQEQGQMTDILLFFKKVIIFSFTTPEESLGGKVSIFCSGVEDRGGSLPTSCQSAQVRRLTLSARLD